MYIYFFIINRDLRLGDLERLGELGENTKRRSPRSTES